MKLQGQDPNNGLSHLNTFQHPQELSTYTWDMCLFWWPLQPWQQRYASPLENAASEMLQLWEPWWKAPVRPNKARKRVLFQENVDSWFYVNTLGGLKRFHMGLQSMPGGLCESRVYITISLQVWLIQWVLSSFTYSNVRVKWSLIGNRQGLIKAVFFLFPCTKPRWNLWINLPAWKMYVLLSYCAVAGPPIDSDQLSSLRTSQG